VKNRLEEIRKSRNMLQEELADALEVSRQTISSLENGRYNPSIILAFKIARLFGMRIEDIFIYEDESDRAASLVEQKKRDLHKKWGPKN
jgi:putative transcriptional regulator